MSTRRQRTLLEVKHLSCKLDRDTPLLQDVSFSICEKDILILQGKSGCGKSTLLKCLSHLNVYDGEILYRGKPPKSYGIPTYRTHVLYVPQRPSLLPGSPRDFLTQLRSFSTHKHNQRQGILGTIDELARRSMRVASEWGVSEELWDRPWSTLSGGESQRIAMATAVGLDCAEILLLDEPTSALDMESSLRVEKYLQNVIQDDSTNTKALIWITHSAEQGQRVGTRFIEVSDGSCKELLVSDAV